jgi:hypothetical protein
MKYVRVRENVTSAIVTRLCHVFFYQAECSNKKKTFIFLLDKIA